MIIQTSLTDFVIRSATRSDCGLVLELIRELADYEKLAHQVVATEATIEQELFGPNSAAEVIIGDVKHQPVGFALFFQNFSTFLGKRGIYLEDLFVRPEYRGQGYGKSLLSCLANIAIDRGCGRLEWAVLDWNKPAIDFYNSLGAESMDQWIINRLTGDKLKQLAEQFAA